MHDFVCVYVCVCNTTVHDVKKDKQPDIKHTLSGVVFQLQKKLTFMPS
jgi:hypothetical protein